MKKNNFSSFLPAFMRSRTWFPSLRFSLRRMSFSPRSFLHLSSSSMIRSTFFTSLNRRRSDSRILSGFPPAYLRKSFKSIGILPSRPNRAERRAHGGCSLLECARSLPRVAPNLLMGLTTDHEPEFFSSEPASCNAGPGRCEPR